MEFSKYALVSDCLKMHVDCTLGDLVSVNSRLKCLSDSFQLCARLGARNGELALENSGPSRLKRSFKGEGRFKRGSLETFVLEGLASESPFAEEQLFTCVLVRLQSELFGGWHTAGN